MLTNRIFHLSIGWLLNSLAYSIIYPFLPLYLHQYRGIDMKLVGLSFPCMAVGAMIGPPFAGMLVDRLGRRRVLIGGTSWRGGIFVVLALMAWQDAPFWLFTAVLFINSAGTACCSGAWSLCRASALQPGLLCWGGADGGCYVSLPKRPEAGSGSPE